MSKLYFTLTGCNHYYGTSMLEKGTKIKLRKDPDNVHDKEAIAVFMKGLDKIGYVANSHYMVKGDSLSAGRLYDKIGDKAKAKVVVVFPGGAICKIVEKKNKDKGDQETNQVLKDDELIDLN